MLALGAMWQLSLLASAQPDRESVILITLDGARTEEIFGGLDLGSSRTGWRSAGGSIAVRGSGW